MKKPCNGGSIPSGPAMKPGKIVEKFAVAAKGGKQISVVFRFPRVSDAKAVLSFINQVRGEAEFLGQRHRETLASEKKFLRDVLKKMRARKKVLVFAKANGKIIGNATISADAAEARSHLGEFGIALLEQFTGLGIGTRLGKCVLGLAKTELKLKLITSFFFSKNARSRALHARLGFKQYGILPKAMKLKRGGFDDEVCVYKTI